MKFLGKYYYCCCWGEDCFPSVVFTSRSYLTCYHGPQLCPWFSPWSRYPDQLLCLSLFKGVKITFSFQQLLFCMKSLCGEEGTVLLCSAAWTPSKFTWADIEHWRAQGHFCFVTLVSSCCLLLCYQRVGHQSIFLIKKNNQNPNPVIS